MKRRKSYNPLSCCYDFLRDILKDNHNIEIPDSETIAVMQIHNFMSCHFKEVEKPIEGDVVSLSNSNNPFHVGYYLSLIHISEPTRPY